MRSATWVLSLLLLITGRASGSCPAGATTAAFTAPGPFGIGVRTLSLVDTTRVTPAHGTIPEAPDRTLVTEIWYPMAPGSSTPVRNAPLAAGGPFPLVVNSPGYGDSRLGEGYLGKLLATRGYVVASLDFPVTGASAGTQQSLTDVQNQPGDVSFVIDNLLALSGTAGSWLEGGVNRHRIGVSGLSLGGLTTLLVTYHPTLRDRRVRASLALAPVSCFFGPAFYATARRPLLLMQGDQDLLVPLATNSARAFALSRSARWLVTLLDGTHTAFSGFVNLPSDTSYDEIGCAAVADIAMRGDPTEGLGGAAAGIEAGTCALPCLDPEPSNVPMQAARQHDLTKAVGAAFFDATLGRSGPARCFLRESLGTENADLTVQMKRMGRP